MNLIAADERCYIVKMWHDEVCYRVAQHASSARPLQLHTSQLMNDLLKASEAASSAPVGTSGGRAAGQASGDGGDEVRGAPSEDASSVGMSAASVDSPDHPAMTLQGLGRDTAALCRVIKAAMEMHRSAQAAHERTGTSPGQVDAEIEALIVARAAGWKVTIEQSRDILKWADKAAPMVGKPRRSGLRVSGELPPPPPPSGRPGASSGTPFSQAPCAPSGAEHTTVDAFAETWDDMGGGAEFVDGGLGAQNDWEGDDDAVGSSGDGVVRMLAGVEVGGRGALRSAGGTAVGTAAEGSTMVVGGGTPQGAPVFEPAAAGGRASAPAGGRRAAAALPTPEGLRVFPEGASGRHGRDGLANGGSGEAANGMDAVMAAVAASMKDQARQFNVTAELRRQELRNKRIAKYTKLVLANPGNDMYAKMLAAEAAGEDGDGDEDASP